MPAITRGATCWRKREKAKTGGQRASESSVNARLSPALAVGDSRKYRKHRIRSLDRDRCEGADIARATHALLLSRRGIAAGERA